MVTSWGFKSPHSYKYFQTWGSPMKYKLETKYCWLNDTTNLVLMYFIQGIPFTFDECEDWFYDYEVIDEANNQPQYDMGDVIQVFFILNI